MKFKFYLLPLLLFLFIRSGAQNCTSLSCTYTTSESRCVSTGSITLNVAGGSGNYNFKATGPVSTPVTSSNVITGLAAGYYTVWVKDLTTGCTKEIDSIYVNGSYSDPRFQLTKTDASCAGNDGMIFLVNQQYGRSPFTYTIIAPSPSNVGASNTTGNFTGLLPGEYAIQLQDSCGGIQVRHITVENYNWWFDSVSVVRTDCNSADVFIRIKDNKGNINTSGGFAGFMYGYIESGNPVWNASYHFTVSLGTQRTLSIVVKDNCGNVHSTTWSLPDNLKPSLSGVTTSNLSCTDFSASVTGQNLTAPSFCLYDNSGNQLTCNSTGVFNNLSYGSYCIQARDNCYDTTISRCFTVSRPTPSVSSTVSISNKNCTTFTATITGQTNLTSPSYCLYDATNVQVQCNSTGIFNTIPYGSYCIEVHDGCTDTIIRRCFTVTKPVPTLTTYSFTGSSCSSFGVQVSGNNLISPEYCLYDQDGNVITCNSTGIFDNLPYGHYCVSATSCGDVTNSICFDGVRPVPSVGASVQISSKTCTSFSAAITGQTNLTTPDYCLYDNNDVLITCNSTGVFDNIPYGSYCIKIHNTCYDTTITRCFSQLRPVPSVNGTLQLLGSTCTTVSFQAGGTNLTSPSYCLYDAGNNLLECSSTGLFSNYPYGQYCVAVHDGCVDTTMRVCQTFSPVKGITVTTSKSCTINSTYLNVQFTNGNSPYIINVYYPNDSLVYHTTTSSNPYQVELSALPTGAKYKVVGTDNCGNKDSAMITPDANIVTTTTTVRSKCPSSVWQNGSGDIIASPVSNYYGVIPQIINKNGTPFIQSYSSVSNNVYTFADLEPAEYIVEYTQSNCNGKLHDTVTVSPYVYPTQGQSAVYQCDNSGFSLSADVKNGVSPYSYQIIGSVPESPSIASPSQSDAVFSINNGTTYSLIRMRTVDACGNATLSDVSVLPLQNISVSANNSCFYQNITLSVDTIPNATYAWYRKTTPTDSVLIGSGLSYNLPFFVPEQAGQYICKVNVNSGCLTRLSSFDLTGDCYGGVLATSFKFSGKKSGNANRLFWNNANEKEVTHYIIERKQDNEPGFSAIGNIVAKGANSYSFDDDNFGPGLTQYRLKVVYQNKTEFSNVVSLQGVLNEFVIYPNPVKEVFKITFNSEHPVNYSIELISSNGQLVYTTEIKNMTSSTFTYQRENKIKPGIYLLKITDQATGRTEIRKLVFE